MGSSAHGTQVDRHLECWRGVGTFKDLGLGFPGSWGCSSFYCLCLTDWITLALASSLDSEVLEGSPPAWLFLGKKE